MPLRCVPWQSGRSVQKKFCIGLFYLDLPASLGNSIKASGRGNRKDMREIELLAPAADLQAAIAAINAGADSVYIGGPAFGARARAGNTMQDIEKAVSYAHLYKARCFLTLNTLIYEKELPQALQIARQAYECGVDALIIQDLGLIEAGLPPIEIHASTQCHIDTPAKARFLEALGFERLVLARELSLKEIAEISNSVRVSIETFVHGALCVSYSGQCYMSCYMNGRSGNRGECAQSCRLPYDLLDERGEVLQKGRYLLSMKDFNASRKIEDLLKAGVSCLKIEGRLKDADYVKNVTARYRKELDSVLDRIPAWEKYSQGEVYCDFEPDLQKTFHREYTAFNLSGNRGNWAVFGTPKATGKKIGKIGKVSDFRPGKYSGLVLDIRIGNSEDGIAAGDGLCYFDRNGELRGGQVEKVLFHNGKWTVWMQGPDSESGLPVAGEEVFRNQDKTFEREIRNGVTERKIAVRIGWDKERYAVYMEDPDRNRVYERLDSEDLEPARDKNLAVANAERQLSKLGGTAYRREFFEAGDTDGFPFIPMSLLNRCRRSLVEKMDRLRQERYRPLPVKRQVPDWDVLQALWKDSGILQQGRPGYMLNVANSQAEELYRRCGAEKIDPAFELIPEKERRHKGESLLMICKHCIRFQLGRCLKEEKRDAAYEGDLFLCHSGYKFVLRFDCSRCRMEVWSVEDSRSVRKNAQ